MSFLIAGRFLLQERIGEGTYAEIWRAADSQDGDVALKIFRPSAVGDPLHPWQSVINEVVAGLRTGPHPNIVRARAFLQVRHFGQQETPCLVMDYVEGLNLAEWLLLQPPPSLSELQPRLDAMRAVLRGIGHVHASGVAHSDISFGNILIPRSSPAKAVLTDFGCAVIDDPIAAGRRPEAALEPINPPVDPSIPPLKAAKSRDVYGFATLCYLTFSGRHPLTDDWQRMRAGQWHGVERPHATLARRRMIDLAPWMVHDGRLAALSDLLFRCVSADPDARPESAVELEAGWDRAMT